MLVSVRSTGVVRRVEECGLIVSGSLIGSDCTAQETLEVQYITPLVCVTCVTGMLKSWNWRVVNIRVCW